GYGLFGAALRSKYASTWKSIGSLVALRLVAGIVVGICLWSVLNEYALFALAPVRIGLWWISLRLCLDGKPRTAYGDLGFPLLGMIVSFLLDAPAGMGAIFSSGLWRGFMKC